MTGVENLLYFQAAQDHEEDDIYQDIAEPEEDIIPLRTKHLSENDNEADLFSTAESSQNDATEGDAIEMNETQVEAIDEDMKEVMEKLDQDLHRIVQISDEIERAMAVSESQQSNSVQQSEGKETPDNEEVMEREKSTEENNEPNMGDQVEEVEEVVEEVIEDSIGGSLDESVEESAIIEGEEEEEILEGAAGEAFDEDEYLMQELDDTDETENFSNLTQEEQSDQSEMTTIVEYDATNVNMDEISSAVPMAIEEDDEDFNDIDYIDEEDDDIAGAISDDRSEGSVEEIDRPFSADVFERHVQQVIAEDFPDDKNAKAPAVQIISSKLNEIMSREAVAAKPTPEVVLAPYEVVCQSFATRNSQFSSINISILAQGPPVISRRQSHVLRKSRTSR